MHPRRCDVIFDIPKLSYGKLLLLVHEAESAFVVRTPNGGLDDQRKSLGGRAVDRVVVSHVVKWMAKMRIYLFPKLW
jgi:hypothetical protein